MRTINLIWAVPVFPGKESHLKNFYQTMLQAHHNELLAEMKKVGNAHYYGAFLQTRPIGPWLIEYWSGEWTCKEVYNFYKTYTSPFREWYIREKTTYCGNHPKKITGVRKLVDCNVSHAIPQGDKLGNVLPIKPQKLGEAVAYIDSIDRADPEARTAYFKKTGLAYWQAWLEEYDGQHFLIQMHDMAGDFEHFRRHYEQEKTKFAKMIKDGWLKHFDMDLTDPEQWQKVESLLSLERHD